MQGWRVVAGFIAVTALAASLAAQTPVLSSLETPYPALQNSQPIHLAGNSYSAGQVAYGPVGTPLILTGSNFGGDGEVWFVSYKNGAVVTNASVQSTVTMWTPTAVTLSVPAGATSGLVRVVTGGKSSNGLPFMVMPGIYSGSCSAAPVQNQLQIQTASLQDGAVNKLYSVALQATGGSNSYSWSLVAGSLPAGLVLSSSGTISGTPSAISGPVFITVQVSDTSTPQQIDAATLSIEIAAQTEAVSSTALYSFSIANASGGSGYDGVGNVTAYTDLVNGIWSFNYDTLNRLANASGTQPDNLYPNYCWQYDSFGNRLWQTSSDTPFSSTAGGPNACPVMAGPIFWAHYNVTNGNRMDSTSQNPNQSQYYDASGNVTNDGVNAYLYDGEGRICAVQQQIPGIGTAMTQYLYDADGNRVAKGNITQWSCDNTLNSNGQPNNGFTPQSAYVLGPHGEQLTEMNYQSGTWQWLHTNVMAPGLSATYDADTSGKIAGPIYFHLSDWLGTRRQQTDYAGNPVLNFTGLPYGDGLVTIPVSNIDAADATEHHFTGKERDTESGNDYFEARYYSSAMGRFMSPDPMGGHYENPQTLNKYAYVINNPLTMTDPTGLDIWLKGCGDNSATCQNNYVGTTDKDGAFSRTHLTGDQTGDATLGAHGISVTVGSGDSAKTYAGVWDTNKGEGGTVTVAGAGALSGYKADVTGNCGGTCVASGSITSTNPSAGNITKALFGVLDTKSSGYVKNAGTDAMNFFHPGATNFRGHSSGDPSGMPSTHIPIDPKASLPNNEWHVDGSFPYDGVKDWLTHAGCATHTSCDPAK